MGALDKSAIDRVRDEVTPDPRDADELHDALLTAGFLLDAEVDPDMCATLVGLGRVTRARTSARPPDTTALWVATERVPELLAVHPAAALEPVVTPPPSRVARTWTREDALVEILRGRMAIARTDDGRRAGGERRSPSARHRRGASGARIRRRDPSRHVHAGRRACSSGATGACSLASIAIR